MAELGSTVVYGDLLVTGEIKGKGAGSGEGGILSKSEDLGATIADTTVVGGKIRRVATSTSAVVSIGSVDIEGLQYGLYSVIVRLRLSNITNTANLIKITTSHIINTTEIVLNTAYIKPSDIKVVNTWANIGMVTDFKGTANGAEPKLRVKLETVANPVANNVDIDYIRVSPAYTAIFSLPNA